MTSTFTSDFRHEFESERADWIRRRVLWYTAVVAGFALLNLLLSAIVVLANELPESAMRAFWLQTLSRVIAVGVYASAFFYVRSRSRRLSRESLLSIVFWTIVITGLAAGLKAPAVSSALSEASSSGANFGPGMGWLMALFMTHFVAALFIPWTPAEAMRPMTPLMIIYSLVSLTSPLFSEESWPVAITVAVLSWSIVMPGVIVAWFRHGRFKDRFHYKMLRGKYGEMKRELVDARRIHESLFPNPVHDGVVRFDYRYEPMRQIGGDFLFSHWFPGMGLDDEPPEPLSVVIIDVTGHGIPAALTVNRLHGEMERVFAEEPDISPGEVLRSLNRYVSLTLARHSVFATAICLRVDSQKDTIEWASAGHPPAFLRAIDGRIEELGSTTFILGAAPSGEFDPDEQSARFGPGDTLIAYTDGATEAISAEGKMLRVEGLRRIVAGARPDAGPGGGWASAVLRAVDFHREGPPADDTLIVEIFRPLRGAPKSRRESNRSDADQTAGSAESSSVTTSADPSV